MRSENRGKSVPRDIEKMTFEEAYAELKAATERLESSEIDLETTLKEYERACALAKHCISLLDEAEERIRVLTERDGIIETSQFEMEGD